CLSFFQPVRGHRDQRSFPTRRSSDLTHVGADCTWSVILVNNDQFYLCLDDPAAGCSVPESLRKSLKKVAQDLISTLPVVFMTLAAEQGTHLMPGYRKAALFQHFMHFVFTQLKGHPHLLEHHIIGDGCFDRARRMLIVFSTFVINESV